MTAVLGPTNTGKTHLAVERMLGHRSGMIGLPLRLLAREIYDRVIAQKGPRQVALITGEERIVPKGARYFICTTESMPLEMPVAFLAVDEIQLCADPERGHTFTDRLLRARGTEETMVMGASTMRPVIKALVPDAEFVERPRFSKLTYTGFRKITRLPPRSAVVAFSAAGVYELAETLRRQRGGCAVVLGALSPRARNAQVAMYQAGEVDHIVATDAIGMGLNMDLDHVAFSAAAKFDGHRTRRLWPAEIAQIAGRAGRHIRDGTFGTSAGLSPFDADLVSAVEEHRFSALRQLYWRNAELDLRSLDDLLSSLDTPPPAPVLRRKGNADDHMALLALTRLEDVRATACDAAHVRLLWETCQIPDYRKTLADAHVRLVSQIFHHLSTRGRLPEDWMAGLIGTLDRTDGDIDTLTARISHVRTWTYIAHRGDWLDDSTHWQAQTRAIEDRLSDALHERLTLRFVDRRASALVRRIRDEEALLGAVDRNDGVTVEGHAVGRLTGFNFVADADVAEDRTVLAAARRILPDEVSRRARWLAEDPDSAFALGVADEEGSATTAPWRTVTWRGAPVARLQRGPTVLSPAITLLPAEDLSEINRERVLTRLRKWLGHYINAQLGALTSLEKSTLTGAARGLAFQLTEGLGIVPRSDIDKILGTIG
ncbi:MAG: disulfide oxidoreductase, partial [Rhodospirillaceae bacterium]|nr:disulfide oxidoreductase [Rhodospirillaceae bacterium]